MELDLRTFEKWLKKKKGDRKKLQTEIEELEALGFSKETIFNVVFQGTGTPKSHLQGPHGRKGRREGEEWIIRKK